MPRGFLELIFQIPSFGVIKTSKQWSIQVVLLGLALMLTSPQQELEPVQQLSEGCKFDNSMDRICENCEYGGYLEMPQRAFERGILHVRAYAIFPEMPQNRTYSFSVLFSF